MLVQSNILFSVKIIICAFDLRYICYSIVDVCIAYCSVLKNIFCGDLSNLLHFLLEIHLPYSGETFVTNKGEKKKRNERLLHVYSVRHWEVTTSELLSPV